MELWCFQMFQKALFFKNHTKLFLSNWENLGYDSCHKIDKYDVSKCHKDCKKQEKSKFAKKCKKDGGLFKCCIRRDKEYCHECRYCCTLSVCTMKDEVTYYHFTNNSLGTAVAENHITDAPDAAHGFSTDNRLYKNYDFRCLKPKSGVDSSKWPHYEMKGFRKANTKKELNKVQEIPHDINFFNFEDPKVFKEFTKGKDTQIWKKTYGFDKTFRVDGKGSNARLDTCYEHCIRAAHKKFAKKCNKFGGFFKCCIYATRLDQFHHIRFNLKKEKLIEKGPSKISCGFKLSEGNCYHCHATHVCAKKVVSGVHLSSTNQCLEL